MPRLHRLHFSALLLSCAATIAVTNAQQCTLCEDGSAIDPTGTIWESPLNCTFIDTFIGGTPADSDDCIDTQLLGYLNCGCPTYPEDVFCAMCDGGSFDINERKKIPFTGQTCGDTLFVRRSDLASCAEIQQYASFCACPGAPPALDSCSLCGDEMALINPTTVLDSIIGTTCQAAFDYAPFITEAAECVTVQGNAPACCTGTNMAVAAPTKAPVVQIVSSAPTDAPANAPTNAPTSSPTMENDTSGAMGMNSWSLAYLLYP